jgi:hypothetical protein
MAMASEVRFICVAAAASSVAACGGGAALLHPAHVLGEGRVSAGAGASGQFVFGRGASAIDQGRTATNASTKDNAERAFVEGVVSQTALAPGLAPWVGARAGLGGSNEGGLTYTGRAVRVDARHAFGNDTVAVSIGVGASAVLMHPPSVNELQTPPVPTAGRFAISTYNLSATGWGLDVPVLVGWRSSASIVEAWAGVRGGVERVTGSLETVEPGDTKGFASVAVLRGYGGGLAGAAIGFAPFSVALEIDVAYQAVSATATFPSGTPSQRETSLNGLTIAPSGALIGKFW